MIQAIVFDFGNVISRFDYNVFLKRISKCTKKSQNELWEIIFTGISQEYETGVLNSDEFFKKVSTLCGLRMDRNDFQKAFTEIFSPIESTYDLIRNLGKKYKLGLLSNTNEWHFECVIKQMEIFNLFNAVSPSHKVGVMKPDKKMFHDVLKKLALKPEECVFIDDVSEYIDAACKLGFKGIRYIGHEQLLESLRQLNVIESLQNKGI
jgi:putative hydrolase of the HAD superfamily